MGEKAEQGRVIGQSAMDFHAIVVGAGGMIKCHRSIAGSTRAAEAGFLQRPGQCWFGRCGVCRWWCSASGTPGRIRRNELRHSLGPLVGRAAGRVHQQQSCWSIRVWVCSLRLEAVKGTPTGACRSHGIRRPNVDHGMMHVLAARRTNLRHLHPLVLGEARGHDFVGVLHIAMRRHRDRLRHAHYHIGLAKCSSRGPVRRGGSVMRVAGRRAGRDPGQRGSQFRPARAMGHLRNVRSAGRQTTAASFLSHRIAMARPSARLRVGHQRHGRDLARPVTALAVFLEDGQNVAIESRGCICGYWKSGGCRQNRCDDKSSCRTDAGQHADSVQGRNRKLSS